MFTGIVKYLGQVVHIDKFDNYNTIQVDCDGLKNYRLGGSIMLNGACMTLTKVEGSILSFDVIVESLRLTNLNYLKVGDYLNMEPSLTLQDYIDGHLVSGHVDFLTEFLEKNSLNEYWFKLNPDYSKYFSLKGSVCLNGISLTISGLDDEKFKVSLIPKTIEETNLQYLNPGDKVNIEIDVVARYLERLIQK